MKAKSHSAAEYGNDLDLLLSLVAQKGLDPFEADRKKNPIYQLEAEDIRNFIGS